MTKSNNSEIANEIAKNKYEAIVRDVNAIPNIDDNERASMIMLIVSAITNNVLCAIYAGSGFDKKFFDKFLDAFLISTKYAVNEMASEVHSESNTNAGECSHDEVIH